MRFPVLFSGLLASTLALAGQPPIDRLQRPAVTPAQPQLQAFNDLLALPGGFLAVGRNGLIVRGDGQAPVTAIDSPTSVLLTAIAGQPGQPLWAVGHDGVILRGTANGDSWQRVFDGWQFNRLQLEAAQRQLDQAQQALKAAPDDAALQQRMDDAQFYLEDAEASEVAGPSRPFLDLWFRDGHQGWVVGAYGAMLHTSDGGEHWQVLDNLPNPERLHLNSVVESAPGILLVAGEGGRLYRSVDSGASWQTVRQLGHASLYQLIPLATPGDVLVVGFGGYVARSRDAGDSWQILPVPSSASLFGGTRLHDGGVLLLGHGGTLLYSADLEHFRLWREPRQRSWLAAGEGADGSLYLAGRQGLLQVSRAQLQEQGQ
jgi:photosystem II stability/assembly factor-like uncharacterized protein